MKTMAAILAGTALMMGMASGAHALSLTVSDGTLSATITDNGAGDTSLVAGKITFSDLILGTYNISIESATGLGQPKLLWPEALHLDSVEIKSSQSIGQLTFILEDSSLSVPGLLPVSPNAQFNYGISAFTQAGNRVTNTVEYVKGSTTTTIGTQTGIAAGALGTFAASNTAYFDVVNPFLLRDIVTFNFDNTSQGTTSFNAGVDIIPTPEPGTFALLGAGFLGLGLYGRRRMKK